MFELFVMGGPLFMGLITFVFIAALVLAVRAAVEVYGGGNPQVAYRHLEMVRSIGLFALVLGVLGQMIGLYSAFDAIGQMKEGGLSPQMLAGGLKVSSITTIWGLICYCITLLISLGLGMMVKE